MYPDLIGLYLTIAIVAWMVWYAGVEGTLRVFRYIELTLLYQVTRIRLYFMRRKLEQQLLHGEKGMSQMPGHLD
jgi:hypothetical protein